MSASAAGAMTVETVRETVIGWRRYLHQHPELSFQEERTAEFVADTLGEFGSLEISRPTPTSVVARLQGAKPGPVLAIRADIDALPITERNTHDFVSKNPGVMHACGHDGHTAMLLGAAKVLAARRADLAGEVRFIFQHAEELLPGGAEELVNAGVLDGVDLVIGAHLWLPMPVGQVGVRNGPLMASPDIFRITITGSGGHAALPQNTVDPIFVAAQVITNLQGIVSRNVDPLEPAVVTVAAFHTGTATGIIPEQAVLELGIRSFDPATRELLEERIKAIAAAQAGSFGVAAEVEYQRYYPATINHPAEAEFARNIALAAFGPGQVRDLEKPFPFSEDFSFLLERKPGCYLLMGVGDRPMLHNPGYDFNDSCLVTGASYWAHLVEGFLAAPPKEAGDTVPRGRLA